MGDLNNILGLLSQNASLGSSEAGQNLPAARTGLKTSSDFYTKLLTGNRDDLLNLFAPEVNTVTSQYDSARKNAMELSPRGGGRTAQQGEARVAEGKAVDDLLFSARTKGAEGLAGVSSAQGSLGAAELGASSGASGSGASASLTKESNNNSIFSTLGAGIGSLITALILKKTSNNNIPIINNFGEAGVDLGGLIDGTDFGGLFGG